MLIFEREHEQGRGRAREKEREGERGSEAGSTPSAQSLTQGSNPRTMRSRPKPSQTLNRLGHPGAPPSATRPCSHS